MSKAEQTINVNSISRISAGTNIKGEIVSPSDIRLDGNFEGKIITEGKLVVGESASIKGDVICSNMDMYGSITGNVYVKDVLSLKDGCKMNGNINVRRLQVELDAEFNGCCRTIDEATFNELTARTAEKSE